MNKILTTIESVINDAVNNYISVISENYNIDAKELKNLWDNNKSDDTRSVASKTSTKSVASKSKAKNDGNNVTCIYKYIKGKQEGQLCGKNAKSDSNYCTKHLKFETGGQKEKKSIIPKEEVVKVSKVEKCIRYNKDINRWWHQETKLIFKSNLDKVVVGIYRNDNIEKLNDEDCNVCEKYGFKYTKNEVEEPKKSVEPVKKIEEPKKSVEPVKKIEEPKKSVEPVKKVEAPKKVIEPVKKIEEPKKTVKKVEETKKKISEQIIETNYYAKNVEDVIGDMLNEVDGDEDEDDHDTLEDEVLDENFDFDEEEEEELLEEDEE